jgi:hypothetical protein
MLVFLRLAKALLRGDDLSQIRERWSEIAQRFQSEKAAERFKFHPLL